jgi:hypothetical protein
MLGSAQPDNAATFGDMRLDLLLTVDWGYLGRFL